MRSQQVLEPQRMSRLPFLFLIGLGSDHLHPRLSQAAGSALRSATSDLDIMLFHRDK